MTLARPPVVSQTEWDAALTALLERERAVAAAMHELAAVRRHDEFDDPPPSTSGGARPN